MIFVEQNPLVLEFWRALYKVETYIFVYFYSLIHVPTLCKNNYGTIPNHKHMKFLKKIKKPKPFITKRIYYLIAT